MKKILLFLLAVSLSYAMEFSPKKLADIELKGISKNISYKTNEQRDKQIGDMWVKFLDKASIYNKSTDGKIYVVYTNTKANSFDYFIGIKSNDSIDGLASTNLKASNYQHTALKYNQNSDMSAIWKEIKNKNPNSDKRQDIEVYDMNELTNNSYTIDIYLSVK
jgi:predicted transcriptional regulator YdeE